MLAGWLGKREPSWRSCASLDTVVLSVLAARDRRAGVRWRSALLVALLAHAAAVLLFSAPSSTARVRVESAVAISVELQPFTEAPANGQPGGGARGTTRDGDDVADDAPARSPQLGKQVADDNLVQLPRPPPRAAAKVAQVPREHASGDDVVVSESEVDEADAYSVAAAAKHGERLVGGVALRPARASRLTPGARARGSNRPGSARGTGPGRGGGPGGHGSGPGGAFPFGGAEGHFLAQVCFIPEGTHSLRSLGACQVETTFRTNQFNVPTRVFDQGFPGVSERSEWFAILYTGSFEASRAGMYEFALASDDGSILEINDEVVVDNDGLHGSVVRRGQVRLEAGTHRLRLRYFQGPRVMIALQLWVTPPGKPRQLMGPSI